MQINIHTPCHENWTTMSPTQQGKFCSSCQKEVHNFSKHSLLEIKQFFEGETGATCGRFRTQQLEAFNARYQALPTPSRIRQWAAAAILVAVVAAPSFGQTPVVSKPSLEAVPSSTTIQTPIEQEKKQLSKQVAQKKTITLSGTVVSGPSQEIVPFAIIWIPEVKIGVQTDLEGKFQLELPFSEEATTLKIRYWGYQDMLYTIVPNKNQKALVIEIKEVPHLIISGDTTVMDGTLEFTPAERSRQ